MNIKELIESRLADVVREDLQGNYWYGYGQALTNALQWVEEANPWIPAEWDLPEHGVPVLVICDSGVEIALYTEDEAEPGGFWYYGIMAVEGVTYWQSIAEIP